MDLQGNSVGAFLSCSLAKTLCPSRWAMAAHYVQFLKETTFMLHNPLKSHRILVAGLASAALWLGVPRHAWSQG